MDLFSCILTSSGYTIASAVLPRRALVGRLCQPKKCAARGGRCCSVRATPAAR